MAIVDHDKPLGDPGALGVAAAYFQNTADTSLTGGGGETGTFAAVRQTTGDWVGPASNAFRSTVDGYNQACVQLDGVFGQFAAAIRRYQSDLQAALDEWNRGETLQATVNGLVANFQNDFRNRDGWTVIDRTDNDIFDPNSNLIYWIKNDITDSRLPGNVHGDAANLWSQIQAMWTAYDNANQLAGTARSNAIAAFNAIQANDIVSHLATLSTPLETPGALNPHAGDPVPLSQAQSVTITVQPGDNLTTIARKYYGTDDWHVVYDNNPDFAKQFPNPNLIYPGATLVLANTVKGAWSPNPVTLRSDVTTPYVPPAQPIVDSAPVAPATPPAKATPANWGPTAMNAVNSILTPTAFSTMSPGEYRSMQFLFVDGPVTLPPPYSPQASATVNQWAYSHGILPGPPSQYVPYPLAPGETPAPAPGQQSPLLWPFPGLTPPS